MREIVVVFFLIIVSLCPAADIRHGYFHGKPVTFENQGGLAVYQGDIILGRTTDIERETPSEKAGAGRESSGITWETMLWPGGVIPYTLDPAFSAPQRRDILEAIEHWNSRTPIRLVQRTNEAVFVTIQTDNDPYACRSNVGRVSGGLILLPLGCGVGETIHEIGHTVGLWHEHGRTDRNRFMTVLYENMEKTYSSAFNERIENAADIGPYDYNSIMHYGPEDFARESAMMVMESVPAGIPFGQREALSAGDIDAVRRMYSQPASKTTISSTPSGLQIRVDGTLVDDGTEVDWAPGSRHTVEAPTQGDSFTRYVFGSWSDGGDAAHTVDASADRTVLVANFIAQHRVLTAISPTGSGAVTFDPPSADGFYPERSKVRVKANPASGYNFLRWNWSAARSANPSWVTILYPSLVTATFTQNELITIGSNIPGRVAMVDGVRVGIPANFAWPKDEQHTVGIDRTQPDWVRFEFRGWADGGPETRTISSTGKAATYTANFVKQYPLALSQNTTSSSVTVNPQSPNGFYDENAAVQLTAVPARNFAFLGWSGDAGGLANPLNLVMDNEKVIQAKFGSPSQVPQMALIGAATGSSAAVAPGQLVSVFGSNIGPATAANLQVVDDRVTTELSGTQVLFDGKPGAITYVSAGQINVVVPYSVSGVSSTTLQVRSNGKTSPSITVPVQEAVPGIFTANSSGQGQGAILNQDGTYNSADNPAKRGSVIVFYATGAGLTVPRVADGQVASSVYPKPELPVSARIGGQPAVVHYAGAAPNFVSGLLQLNVQVPSGIESGPRVPVSIVVGNQTSPPGVTIAVD